MRNRLLERRFFCRVDLANCEFYVWKLRKIDVIVTFEVIKVTY